MPRETRQDGPGIAPAATLGYGTDSPNQVMDLYRPSGTGPWPLVVAIHGGAFVWVLGVILHYFIAFSAATVYCLTSRRLKFLWDHFVVCGLLYGMAFYLVMKLIVLPLCALHLTGPFQLRDLLQGLLVHMVIIGLPISSSLRKLST